MEQPRNGQKELRREELCDEKVMLWIADNPPFYPFRMSLL
jgi:hypothetical protein